MGNFFLSVTRGTRSPPRPD